MKRWRHRQTDRQKKIGQTDKRAERDRNLLWKQITRQTDNKTCMNSP